MKMHNAIILLIILPLFGAGVCLLEKFVSRFSFAKIVSVATLLGCLILLIGLYPGPGRENRFEYIVGGWNELVGIHLVFDALAWMSLLIVLGISLLALLFAIAENTYEVTFYFLYLISVAGMTGVILAADLFNMFVCFEILGIAAYILIAYFQKGHAVLASFKYLILSSLGMAFMLIGILIIYQHTGTLSLIEAGKRLSIFPMEPLKISVAVAALVAGIGVRTAFIPFHTWLPEAHAYAPHPVSAVLSGVVIKISFLAIWRIVNVFQAVVVQKLFIWIGATTALIGVIWALSQIDCKQLLAWHSISQMGYILTSFGIGTPHSMTASYIHILNHALFKSLLFLCIGSVIHVTGERNVKKLGNLARALPVLMLAFLIGAFSIAGIPPFNGFVSKKFILYSVKTYPLAYYALWAAGVGTVASFIKLSGIFRKYKSQWEKDVVTAGKLPILAYVPMLFLAALCVITGIWGGSVIKRTFFLLFGGQYEFVYPFYSISGLLNTLLTVGVGMGVYLFIVSRPGQKMMSRIRALHLSFNISLLLLVAGFILFAVLTI